jgi:hypothetical protein
MNLKKELSITINILIRIQGFKTACPVPGTLQMLIQCGSGYKTMQVVVQKKLKLL